MTVYARQNDFNGLHQRQRTIFLVLARPPELRKGDEGFVRVTLWIEPVLAGVVRHRKTGS